MSQLSDAGVGVVFDLDCSHVQFYITPKFDGQLPLLVRASLAPTSVSLAAHLANLVE